MTQAPAFEAWHQPARAERRWRRDAQDFGFTAIGAQVMGRHLDLREDFSDLDQVQVARWRHLQASTHPANSRCCNSSSSCATCLLTALWVRFNFGGPGEAQMPGHGFETLQCSDRWQIAFVQHGRSFVLVSLLPAMHSMNKRNDIS
jgi:hypothetical protein